MELPVSFADYARALLGDEDYKELVLRRTCRSLVHFRFLPGRTPDIYF